MWLVLQREWGNRRTLRHEGRIATVPSDDGDVAKKDPPKFNAPKKLKAKGETAADLAEVDGILEYNKLFSANSNIYWFVSMFLALYPILFR